MIRLLTGREKKIFIICLATVFFCIIYSQLIAPLQGKANTIYQEIAVYQKQINRNLKIIQQAETFNDRYKAYVSQFCQPGTREEAAASILSEIEEIVGKLDLYVMDLKPKRNKHDEFNSQFSVSLTVNSKFSDMIRFLYTLQQPPHLFHVEEVEFEKLVSGEREMMMTRCILSKAFIPLNGEIKEQREEFEERPFPIEFMPFHAKSFKVYAQKIRERDLFQLLEDKPRADTPVLQKALPALQKRIKLIGILLDGDSKAIIEDLKERQVHFLSRGESVGTVFLEDIRRDKVIFMYNNERIEMAL